MPTLISIPIQTLVLQPINTQTPTFSLVHAAPDQQAMQAVLTRIEWFASGTLHEINLPLVVR